MKLNRSVKSYAECSPKAMSTMSPAAIMYAFQDGRADVLILAGLLSRIAYPRRGTPDETKTVQDWAEEIQAVITHDEAVNHIP